VNTVRKLEEAGYEVWFVKKGFEKRHFRQRRSTPTNRYELTGALCKWPRNIRSCLQ
jgi:hypothetical protein